MVLLDEELETELALEAALLATDEFEDLDELDDCAELAGATVELFDDELLEEELLATEATLAAELLLEDALLAVNELAELILDTELADDKLLLDDELTTAGAELAAGGGEELLPPPPPQAERTLTKERLKIREPARIKASL